MHSVVEGHGARVELAALQAGPRAKQQGKVWRDGEDHKLPPTGVLSHYDGNRQPGGQQTQDHISQFFQALMKSSPQSYISQSR